MQLHIWRLAKKVLLFDTLPSALCDLLDASLEKNDLEELETIHWYLHEGKDNLINIINECNLIDAELN